METFWTVVAVVHGIAFICHDIAQIIATLIPPH